MMTFNFEKIEDPSAMWHLVSTNQNKVIFRIDNFPDD